MKELSGKFTRLSFCALFAFLLATLTLVGCSQEEAEDPDAPFSYSMSIADNGYWKGVKATDSVELPEDYSAIEVPEDTYAVNDEAVQNNIDSLLTSYSTTNQITDRAIVDGDTVNIDYVGSVDGVEFEGGSTAGAGTEVTIGVTNYIGNFLEQLVGHTPGETYDVHVTFPEDYAQESLRGKDAVFVVTVNHIAETVEPELTDEFVATNFKESYGWSTVDELKKGIRDNLQKSAIQNYIDSYITENSTVESVPEKIINYEEKGLINYYEENAKHYEMELDEFMSTYLNASNTEELLENNKESIEKAAKHTLIIQAIAEKQNISPNDEDVANYFSEVVGTDDYSSYEEQYGMPYLKQATLSQMVFDYLVENAKLG